MLFRIFVVRKEEETVIEEKHFFERDILLFLKVNDYYFLSLIDEFSFLSGSLDRYFIEEIRVEGFELIIAFLHQKLLHFLIGLFN